MWTVNFQMFKLVLEKAEEPEIKLPTSAGSWQKQESSRKTSISALLTISKPLTVLITITVENSERDGNTRPTDLPLEKSICMSGSNSRTEHGKTDWFQIGKGVHQGCILSPCLFDFYVEYLMRMLGWRKHKLESRSPGEISITSDMQMTPPLWQKVKNYRASWWKWTRRVKKLA